MVAPYCAAWWSLSLAGTTKSWFCHKADVHCEEQWLKIIKKPKIICGKLLYVFLFPCFWPGSHFLIFLSQLEWYNIVYVALFHCCLEIYVLLTCTSIPHILLFRSVSSYLLISMFCYFTVPITYTCPWRSYVMFCRFSRIIYISLEFVPITRTKYVDCASALKLKRTGTW